jgi:plastocyanin
MVMIGVVSCVFGGISGLGAAKGADPETVIVSVRDTGFFPSVVNIRQGSTVRWDFVGPGTHTATGSTGLRLFSSGPREPGSSYAFQFVAAGKYLYADAYTANTGKVKVPIQLRPRTRPIGATFTVTWAHAKPPPDYDYDVQIKWPGSTSFVQWMTHTVETSGSFQPDMGPGDYLFRARVRRISSDKTSGWSPVRAITVTR